MNIPAGQRKIPSSTGFCGLSLKPHFLGKIDGFLGVFA